jgi:hypothetical protein
MVKNSSLGRSAIRVSEPVGHREQRGDRSDVPDLAIGEPCSAGSWEIVLGQLRGVGGDPQGEVGDRRTPCPPLGFCGSGSESAIEWLIRFRIRG